LIFHVDKNANKDLVAKSVTEIFKVKVEKVNIIKISGKVKRAGKIIGKRKDIKKAVVTLKKGEKIKEIK